VSVPVVVRVGGQLVALALDANYCLGVHFMIGLDLDVHRSEAICGVFE
jgi:hypothetical protein